MFTIKHERDHYAVYKDGIFYCSADTYAEAEADIEAADKLRKLIKKLSSDCNGCQFIQRVSCPTCIRMN